MNPNLLQTVRLQQIASDPKNSAWVFASAGSGKTKILTDRVLRLLLDDVPPHKILCLTFTKVAAAEMQNRINSELAKWILCDDAELQKKLSDLSGNYPSKNELQKARILFVKLLDEEFKIKVQTIHSFCQSLIKIFPFEAKVKPNFELLESNQEKLLLRRARKEVLQRALSDEKLQNLVEQTNAKLHESSFAELMSELLGKKEQLNSLKEKFFGIENVIAEIFKNFSVAESQNPEEIFADFFLTLDQKKLLELASILEESGSITNEKTAIRIKNFLQNPLLENFESYQLAFFTLENEARKISGKPAKNPDLLALMDDCRKAILACKNQLNSLQIASDSALLLRFTSHILENYSQLKRQNSFLDYNDLIVETNRLLANPDFSDWVKLKMDSSFDHLLIDESQDTNQQQWLIIKALSEDFFSGLSLSNQSRSLFIVGDEKQSIYSFQGAEPNISSEIFAYFSAKLGANLKRIELNNSFRSKAKILQAVDEVFADSGRKNSISKLAEFQKHKPIREGLGKVEIWPQIRREKPAKKEENYDWKIDFSESETAEEEEILAEIIARKINSWVNNGKALEDREKPVNYGDFMILLRNRTNGFDAALAKFFHQYQIPFTSVSKIKFSKSLLIQDLLAAAKFALLPDDDLNLACLLKSPIFEISEEDLLEICLVKNSNQSTIYSSFNQLPKFNSIKQILEEFVVKSQELNCFEFFHFLLHQKNYQQNFIAYFGVESLEILDKFTLNAFDFCQNFSPNLQKFLEFIENLDPEISLYSEETNRVKITTIHSAKGLQAPIVLIPDCCYNFNQLRSTKEEISWLEIGIDKIPIWCRKKDGENLALKKHRREKLTEAKEEYLRLLYVAMTRAEDELYIGGFGSAHDSESWYEVIKNSVSIADFVSEEGFLKPIEITPIQSNSESKKSILLPIKIEMTKPFQNQINQGQIKGRLIHKILEIIGKNHREEKDWLLAITKKIIEKEEFLSDYEKNEIHNAIVSFVNSEQFQNLFSGKVRCEVEIIGQKILRRIDLLIEKENEILIVDYKSDEALPGNIPQHYLDQLKTYEQLIKNLYPSKKISCAILWVKFLKLQMLT